MCGHPQRAVYTQLNRNRPVHWNTTRQLHSGDPQKAESRHTDRCILATCRQLGPDTQTVAFRQPAESWVQTHRHLHSGNLQKVGSRHTDSYILTTCRKLGPDTQTVAYKWGCSWVGRASDRHAADAGFIPRFGRGFFFFLTRINIQCRLSYGVRTPLCAITCINMCAHVKSHVVIVRVLETLKALSMHRRLGSATLL